MFNEIIINEQQKYYFIELQKKLDNEYKYQIVYPEQSDIYNAFKLTPYKKVKVVILGQDPYHNHSQAHGLAFSVNIDEMIPPSLRNIYKELKNDLGIEIPSHGNLTDWATEGVLLLNTTLTVRKNEPNSHQNLGWEIFTDNVIKLLNNKEEPIVFVLWGNKAKRKKKLITNTKHLVIEGVHPSPLSASRGFFGSKPFSKVNNFLKENNIKEINWSISSIDIFGK